MFKPHRLTDNWESRVESAYRAPVAMNAGALVDVSPTDLSAVTGSDGFSSLITGSLQLCTTTTAANNRELGVLMTNVIPGGVPLIERVLGLSTNYFSVPEGMNAPVYKTTKGDVVGTTEYVGYLTSDSGAPGFLDITNTSNYLAQVSIFNGRFRLAQGGDLARARWFGLTSQGGVSIALFEIL
jgi:hypothetical protein